MATFFYDSLEYAKNAKALGFTLEQAEFQAQELAKIARSINEELVTKQDLRNDLQEFEEHLTNKLTIRFGGMLITAVSVLAVLITVVHG